MIDSFPVRPLASWYLSLSLLLFLASLLFDGAHLSGGSHMPALQMLLYGPWAMPFGLFQWFANPLLALAILAHQRFRRLALLLGLAALYIALGSLSIERLPDNLSYAFHDVIALGIGFYLWALSMLAFCLGQGWWCWRARSAADVPGWRWTDIALIAALALAAYGATQMPSLRFEPGRILMPPEPSLSV